LTRSNSLLKSLFGVMDRYKGVYYLSCDNTHYINHSEQPTMYGDETGFLAYAAKDIYPGEEIVDDYRNLGETEEDSEFNLRWLRNTGNVLQT